MMMLRFDDIEDFADVMHDMVTKFDMSPTAVMYFKEASELLEELLFYDDLKISLIELCDSEVFEYDKEYYVTLFKDDMTICIEEAWNEKLNVYIEPPTNTLLLHEDVSSKIAYENKDLELYEVRIGHECDDEDDCDDCLKCPYCGGETECEEDENREATSEEIEKLCDELIKSFSDTLKSIKVLISEDE